MVHNRAILTMADHKSYMVCPAVPLSTFLNDPYQAISDFKVTPLFDAAYHRNGTRYRHNFNGILIETYTRLT